MIAHEVGHHVQNLTGSFQKMEAARVRWFKRGMDSGRPKDCNTFSTKP